MSHLVSLSQACLYHGRSHHALTGISPSINRATQYLSVVCNKRMYDGCEPALCIPCVINILGSRGGAPVGTRCSKVTEQA